jgi:hypothetical protein
MDQDTIMEICWIVSKRNQWAIERSLIKRTIKRIRKKKHRDSALNKRLKISVQRLKTLNTTEKEKLNSRTSRLRKLLRENPTIDLTKDHLGGYLSIDIFVADENGHFIRFMVLDRIEIWRNGIQYEASKAIEKFLLEY